DHQRWKTAVTGRVRDNRAGKWKDDPRRLDQNQRSKHLLRRVFDRYHRPVGELDQEDRFLLDAGRRVDRQDDFENLWSEVLGFDVDVDVDRRLRRLLDQALRRPRIFERQIFDILSIDDQL